MRLRSQRPARVLPDADKATYGTVPEQFSALMKERTGHGDHTINLNSFGLSCD